MLPYADLRQTHSAVVFFVGDRAYKLKKPVNLGFLDFNAREAACRRRAAAVLHGPDDVWRPVRPYLLPG